MSSAKRRYGRSSSVTAEMLGGPAQRERRAHIVERQPGVDDVFDDQDVTIDDRSVEVLEQSHASRPTVLEEEVELEEVDRMRHRQRSREVDEEDGVWP